MSTITSVTFSPSNPSPGETVTATVQGDWTLSDVITAQTDDGAEAPGTLVVTQGVKLIDPSGRAWTPVSNNGTQATFTGPA